MASADLLRRENRSAMVLLDEKQLELRRLEVRPDRHHWSPCQPVVTTAVLCSINHLMGFAQHSLVASQCPLRRSAKGGGGGSSYNMPAAFQI